MSSASGVCVCLRLWLGGYSYAGGLVRALKQIWSAELLSHLRSLCGGHPWQPQQIVSGASDNEDSVSLSHASELDLAQMVGLSEQAEGLIDELSPA